jgi:hypothetical protein
MVDRRELVSFGTVETRVCRNEVPNHVMRYKSIGYKMLNGIIADIQRLLRVDTIDRTVVLDQ